jgi:hypothetical protein
MMVKDWQDRLPEFAEAAKGRDHVPTDVFSNAFGVAEQTSRKNYCITGECFCIRPVKVGGRLLWPVGDIVARLLGLPRKEPTPQITALSIADLDPEHSIPRQITSAPVSLKAQTEPAPTTLIRDSVVRKRGHN